VDALVARCTEAETGARNVEHVIRGSLMPELSRGRRPKLGAGEKPARVAVALDAAGAFAVDVA
jgi:type VI secretion system protein VasG